MATDFASQLNAAHQAGIDADGNPGQPLFTGTSAASLTAATLAPDQVAGADASGSNGNMLAQIGRHTSELQSLMRISYAVFCLKKKKTTERTPESQHLTKHVQHNYKAQERL